MRRARTHRAPGDQTYVVRSAEHAAIPILALAHQNSLPKDIVIDLLARGILLMQATLRQQAEKKQPDRKIVLTGFGGQG